MHLHKNNPPSVHHVLIAGLVGWSNQFSYLTGLAYQKKKKQKKKKKKKKKEKEKKKKNFFKGMSGCLSDSTGGI